MYVCVIKHILCSVFHVLCIIKYICTGANVRIIIVSCMPIVFEDIFFYLTIFTFPRRRKIAVEKSPVTGPGSSRTFGRPLEIIAAAHATVRSLFAANATYSAHTSRSASTVVLFRRRHFVVNNIM